jgi:hypothetical protein
MVLAVRRMDRNVVNVKRARVDHPPGAIQSDSSAISSSVILPISHHSTLPPPAIQQSGTPTVPAPVVSPLGHHSVPPTQPSLSNPPTNPATTAYPSNRRATTPLHIQPPAQPPGPSPYHAYGSVAQQPPRTSSQDLSASRPTTATGQPDPHRSDWVTMDGNGGPHRPPLPPHPAQPPPGSQPNSMAHPVNGLPPMPVSAPPVVPMYAVQSPVHPQHQVEHIPPGYPQTPLTATFAEQSYPVGPTNYTAQRTQHKRGTRATQVSKFLPVKSHVLTATGM